MRRLICVALLALTMVLAGCTGGGGNPSPSGTPSSGGGGYIMGPSFTAPLQQLHNSLQHR